MQTEEIERAPETLAQKELEVACSDSAAKTPAEAVADI